MQYTKIPVDPKTQQILEDAHEAVKLKLGLSLANLSAEDVFDCLVIGREHIQEGAKDLVKSILPYLTEDQLVELLIPLLTRPRRLTKKLEK
jgi:hypothetical protein